MRKAVSPEVYFFFSSSCVLALRTTLHAHKRLTLLLGKAWSTQEEAATAVYQPLLLLTKSSSRGV